MNPLFNKFKNSAYLPAIKKSYEKFVGPSVEKVLSAEKAAQIVFKEFEKEISSTRKVVIARKFKNWTLPRLLPSRTVDKFVGKALGLIK